MILASASPRRAAILRTLGISFDVVPADVDESVLGDEGPQAHVERLSRAKAEAVADRFPGRRVIAGDTVVALEEEILGKPGGTDEAVTMLLRLAGRTHRVVSGMTVVTPDADNRTRSVHGGTSVTAVTFRPFDRSVARAYAQTGEPLDKAGGYGIQGMGAALIEGIQGDYSGVVGLPVSLLVELLERSGHPYAFPVEIPHAVHGAGNAGSAGSGGGPGMAAEVEGA